MASAIDLDVERARQILKGKVRGDLKKYVNDGELIGAKGKDFISIPVPRIDRPHFHFGSNPKGAVQGSGNKGDIIGRDFEDGDGDEKAGDQPGDHITEEFTLDELAEMLGEELELPNLLDKGKRQLLASGYRYSNAARFGPRSLMIPKRTLKNAILRSISQVEPPEAVLEPDFNPADHIFISKPDKRFRVPKPVLKERAVAVIIYILDISGSMTNEMKKIVRTMCGWIEIWINHSYKDVESRYIVHDAEAHEVNFETFYHVREAGGTVISSAYELLSLIIDPASGYESSYGGTYDPEQWNIYVFQFTDGDNFEDDNKKSFKALRVVLPKINLLGYAQIGDGQFIKVLDKLKELQNNIVTTTLQDGDDIFDGIKALLGKN